MPVTWNAKNNECQSPSKQHLSSAVRPEEDRVIKGASDLMRWQKTDRVPEFTSVFRNVL